MRTKKANFVLKEAFILMEKKCVQGRALVLTDASSLRLKEHVETMEELAEEIQSAIVDEMGASELLNVIGERAKTLSSTKR